jgi:hypothetical protein
LSTKTINHSLAKEVINLARAKKANFLAFVDACSEYSLNDEGALRQIFQEILAYDMITKEEKNFSTATGDHIRGFSKDVEILPEKLERDGGLYKIEGRALPVLNNVSIPSQYGLDKLATKLKEEKEEKESNENLKLKKNRKGQKRKRIKGTSLFDEDDRVQKIRRIDDEEENRELLKLYHDDSSIITNSVRYVSVRKETTQK